MQDSASKERSRTAAALWEAHIVGTFRLQQARAGTAIGQQIRRQKKTYFMERSRGEGEALSGAFLVVFVHEHICLETIPPLHCPGMRVAPNIRLCSCCLSGFHRRDWERFAQHFSQVHHTCTRSTSGDLMVENTSARPLDMRHSVFNR